MVEIAAGELMRKVPTWAAAMIGIFGTIIMGLGALLYFNKELILSYQKNGLDSEVQANKYEIKANQTQIELLKTQLKIGEDKHEHCHAELSELKTQFAALQVQLDKLKAQLTQQ